MVGIDRRGHGRSSQVSGGHDMDHYAADAAAVVEHLDLANAIHIGHSTGGGEVTRYVAQHGKGRVAKAVLMSAVPPIMLKTPANPGGLPIEVFDGLAQRPGRQSLPVLSRRRRPVRSTASTGRAPKPSQGVIDNWWRQGMMGGSQGALRWHQGVLGNRLHRGSEEHRRADAGDARRRRPDRSHTRTRRCCRSSSSRMATLKIYPGFPHGMLTTHADVINNDLLAFVRG